MRAFIFLVLLCSLSATASAGPKIITVIMKGICLRVQLESKDSSCPSAASVVYNSISNGNILFQVPLANDLILAFVGRQSAQPEPEIFTLYLERVRISAGIEGGPPIKVSGTCRMTTSSDGNLVYRLICNAESHERIQYFLDFLGSGEPVSRLK